MNQFSDQINKLQERIDLLVKKQNQFFNEIEELRETIHELQNSQNELTENCVENPSQIDEDSRMDLTKDESIKRGDFLRKTILSIDTTFIYKYSARLVIAWCIFYS